MAKTVDEETINRDWNSNFLEYTEMIVNHPNYSGLHYTRDSKTGRVKWVVTGKSPQGLERTAWWDDKCRELGIPIKQGCYAIVSRRIHPTGYHVCQCCGKSLSIYYEYPTKNTLKKINSLLGVNIQKQSDYSIFDIIDKLCKSGSDVHKIAKLFGFPGIDDKDTLKNSIREHCIDGQTKMLSPGVMSNNPDRFDGFHSDGLCCREKTDKGRHPSNLKTYIQDRRAYEEWADGNYNLANRLMGEFQKDENLYECPRCHELKRMTADHIGPISLGFCHSIYFSPLCDSCNSSKNNRLTMNDINRLLALEKDGHVVISWHSKSIWDRLKNSIHTDEDAKKLSSIMASYHQNVLYIFGIIYYWTSTIFLDENSDIFLDRYLHPEYSMYDYRFSNFDPFHLEELDIIETPLDSKNKRKNQERYRRVAYESLMSFHQKDNRRKSYYFEDDSIEVQEIIDLVRNYQTDNASDKLKELLAKLAEIVIEKEWDI